MDGWAAVCINVTLRLVVWRDCGPIQTQDRSAASKKILAGDKLDSLSSRRKGSICRQVRNGCVCAATVSSSLPGASPTNVLRMLLTERLSEGLWVTD